MSKSILGIGLTIVGAALMFIPGIGTALGLGTIALGAGLGSIAVASLIGLGLEIAGSLLLGPSVPKNLLTNSAITRLYATLVTTEPRKWWLGVTAGGTDIRYQTYTGAHQEFYHQVLAHASHQVQSIDEIWIDNEKAWTKLGGVQGRYVGWLTVTTRELGTSANGNAIDGVWTATCTLTGCAYSYLMFKLLDPSNSANTSPFQSGVSNRLTIRGKGALIYDPRLDGTVPGGTGTQRAGTQSTWAWDDNASRNPALQLLWYLLGWKINGKLAVGMGLPSARIDLPSFITAANHCDESVTLASTATEPRYRGDGLISEGDDRQTVIENLCATMNATLRDSGGKISLQILLNDLATPVTTFQLGDILGSEEYDQTQPLNNYFNIARGRRVDPSDQALYQLSDFPQISLTAPDGIDRIQTVDFPLVQSNGQVQRIAKLRLKRAQYQAKYTAAFGSNAWTVSLGNIVQLTHAGMNWTTKLFRVAGQAIAQNGQVKMTLLEESTDVYSWAAEDIAGVVAGTPTVIDPTLTPVVESIGSGFNRYIDNPPQSTVFNYDYTGSALAGEFSRDIAFNLLDSAGPITSGITWTYLVLTGTVSTFTNASGAQSMSGGGTGTMTVSSLGSSTASVQISAAYSGKTYVKTITLSQNVAVPPVSSGGSGTTTLASRSSGYTSFGITTFVDVTGSGTPLVGTMPTGKTTANVNVNLNAMPVSGTTGGWTVECKVMRDISGTPTQIGTTQSASSDWNASDVAGDAAPFIFSIADTGLTAGTTYNWRIYMRITSGTRTHNVSHNVSVTA